MRIAIIVAAMSALTLQSCSSPSSDGTIDPWNQWRAAGVHTYTIDQTRYCFCGDGGQTVRITVDHDTIASVIRMSDGTPVNSPERNRYLTVDSLFGIIHSNAHDSVVVRYNPRFGFPESLDLDPQLHPVDGGVLYVSTNLRPVAPK